MKLIRRNPSRLLPAFLVAFALSACGSSSTAPAVDAKLLQERMDAFVTTLTDDTADGELIAKAEGKAKVETQGDGTVVGTLPRLTFTSKNGETAVLDSVVVRFSNGGDGLIKLDAKLPGSLAIRNKDGKVEGEIKIGSQSLTGIWAEKLQTLSNVDMRLSDLTIKADAGTATSSIEQIAITGGMEGKGSGRYDGRYDMTLTGMKADDPKEKVSVKLGSLSVVSAMKGTKMEEWAKAAKEAGYTLADHRLDGWPDQSESHCVSQAHAGVHGRRHVYLFGFGIGGRRERQDAVRAQKLVAGLWGSGRWQGHHKDQHEPITWWNRDR